MFHFPTSKNTVLHMFSQRYINMTHFPKPENHVFPQSFLVDLYVFSVFRKSQTSMLTRVSVMGLCRGVSVVDLCRGVSVMGLCRGVSVVGSLLWGLCRGLSPCATLFVITNSQFWIPFGSPRRFGSLWPSGSL